MEGATITATIRLANANVFILGGQFFLEFDPSVLAVVSVSAGDPPFTFPLFVNVSTRGEIDYSVVVFPFDHPGTSQDTIIGRVHFTVLANDGAPFLRFRLNDPPSPTQLLIANSGLVPLLSDESRYANDLRQFSKLQRCFKGEDVLATAECECLLAGDQDGDIDLLDYWVFSLSWTGPWMPDCP